MGAIWTGAQTIYVTHTPGLHPKCWPLIRKRHSPKPTLQTPARVPEWPDGAQVPLQPPGMIPLQTLATVMGKEAPSLSIAPFINPARCAKFPRQHQALLQLPTAPLTSKAELPAGPRSAKYCCVFQTASLSSTGKGAMTVSLVMCFSIPSPLQRTGSDANIPQLCQASIKALCNNPLLQETAKRPKCLDGALITFPCPLQLTNTGKDTKLPKVTLQIFEGLPKQRKKNTLVLLAGSFSYSYVIHSFLQVYKQPLLK